MPHVRTLLAALAATTAVAGTASAQAQVCSNGAVIAGSPKYQGTDPPKAAGQSIRSDPPLQFRSIVIEGARLYSNSAQEIWIADLHEGQMHRLAGEEQKYFPAFKDGKCADARFMNIHGMAEMTDGSIVVADYLAHAILKVTDPDNDKCTVTYLAGTHEAKDKEGVKGDQDGPGAEAKINRPEWPAADDDGNVYFIDEGSNKLKKVANDDAHTVTTLLTLFDTRGYGYTGITMMGDKLYVVGNTFSNALIFEVDPKTGDAKKILDSGAKAFAPLDASTAPTLSSVTTDGHNLIVTGQGYVWRVTTSGKVTHIAGAGSPLDIPKGYDINGANPAKKLLLRFRNGDVSAMGTTTAMAWQSGVLFWRGRHDGPFILSIGCK